MPVILEQFDENRPSDRDDLLKIYRDHPPLADTDLEAWLVNRLQAASQQLFVGRFNGRLISAVWACKQGQHWRLHDLCVRALTRRRGVARQLLQLLCRRAGDQQMALFIEDDPALAVISPLLSELGFRQIDNGRAWIFSRSPD